MNVKILPVLGSSCFVVIGWKLFLLSVTGIEKRLYLSVGVALLYKV